jgi:hypothetical protein
MTAFAMPFQGMGGPPRRGRQGSLLGIVRATLPELMVMSAPPRFRRHSGNRVLVS